MIIENCQSKWSLQWSFLWYPHVRDVYMIMSCDDVFSWSIPRRVTNVALRCRTWCCHGINECSSILAWEPSEEHSLMQGQGHVRQHNETWAWRFRTVCTNSNHKWSWQIIIPNGHYKWSLHKVLLHGHLRNINTIGRKCTWTASRCPVCLSGIKNMGASPTRRPRYRCHIFPCNVMGL